MKTNLKKIIILAFWLTIWEIVSLIINREIYLPSPICTFKSLIGLLVESETYLILIASTYRTLLGIILSCIFGILLGFICGMNKFLYDIINPVVLVIRSTPIVSIIILAIIWLKSTYVPIFSSLLMCFPVIFTNISTGIKNTDKKLLEVCNIYNITGFNKIKSIYFHSIIPYIHSAIISTIGIAWKATSAAEVLSMPKYSIGTNLFYAKAYLEPQLLFAWTILIVVLSSIFEKTYVKVFKYDKTK
ncbi:ABC transporter permease subunit [Sedimentibacter sp. zth1]|uniref:ABC transporter permease n=1 Tax=Sedimentibacter sp. zth1 TaxID=2816908 RepID=UPI001A9350BD|nr:ABC transporter permease subunit [Sedimentibacter sp. zth1]QSX05849.1 ABC transporter permease subunit [Sedimentibacter sp. zth1]